MKKIITLCLFLCSAFSFAQESNLLGNIRLGGSFGFSLGENSTTLSITPSLVYDFNEEFSIGGSIGYLHNKSKGYSSNVYSAGIITLYRPIPTIEFSGELLQSYVNKTIDKIKEKYGYPSLNIGAAYITGKVTLGIQYDVIYKKNRSINANAISPFIRVFF
ncbi:hypothetical protein PG913_07340 [Tenacibaculum pacificus]|uniref:hypothetical protein n=1 Tax=Tenacibaculum TaxID=104267 RepID=UPI0022F3D04E|nr:hypothetical protein [Tenacibaculum pacificus]WBX72725.1 hypothetical protein PG913_07340 [Tenacibaculum pacificus]